MKEDNAKTEKLVLYSALEVSKICGVVNQTAINWIHSNSLKAFKTPGGQYRVYPDDLATFMKSRNLKVPADVLAHCTSFSGSTEQSVLIVDDDEGLNSVISKFLGKRFPSMQIFQAFDGFDAGMKISENKPSCIVLDLDLPGINGFDLCRRIKSGKNLGNPEIVVVTALDDESVEEKITALGITHFFHKPLSLVTLSDVVATIFRRA